MTYKISTETVTLPGGATVNKQYVYTYNDLGNCVHKEVYSSDMFSHPYISVTASGLTATVIKSTQYMVNDDTQIQSTWPTNTQIVTTAGEQYFITATGGSSPGALTQAQVLIRSLGS
jgi:hypothetical protein